MDTCAFCAPLVHEVIRDDGLCFALWTGELPLGSAMILPREHREAPWDLTPAEWTATQGLLRDVMRLVEDRFHPDGWNVGWNVRPVGGQSVPHAHCHLIPRYRDEPYAGRGLRWWFKSTANARPSLSHSAQDDVEDDGQQHRSDEGHQDHPKAAGGAP